MYILWIRHGFTYDNFINSYVKPLENKSKEIVKSKIIEKYKKDRDAILKKLYDSYEQEYVAEKHRLDRLTDARVIEGSVLLEPIGEFLDILHRLKDYKKTDVRTTFENHSRIWYGLDFNKKVEKIDKLDEKIDFLKRYKLDIILLESDEIEKKIKNEKDKKIKDEIKAEIDINKTKDEIIKEFEIEKKKIFSHFPFGINDKIEHITPIVPIAKKHSKETSKIIRKIVKNNGLKLAPIIFTSTLLRAIQTSYYIKQGFEEDNKYVHDKDTIQMKYIVPIEGLQEDTYTHCKFGSTLKIKKSMNRIQDIQNKENKDNPYESFLEHKIREKIEPEILKDLYLYIYPDEKESAKEKLNLYGDYTYSENTPISVIKYNILPRIEKLLSKSYSKEDMKHLAIIIVSHNNTIQCYRNERMLMSEPPLNNLSILLEDYNNSNRKMEIVSDGFYAEDYIKYYLQKPEELKL